MPKTIFEGANRVVVEAIKSERLRAGLKQEDLAALIEKDQSWISLVENSQRRLDVVEFIRLAQALNIEPTELLARVVARL